MGKFKLSKLYSDYITNKTGVAKKYPPHKQPMVHSHNVYLGILVIGVVGAFLALFL